VKIGFFAALSKGADEGIYEDIMGISRAYSMKGQEIVPYGGHRKQVVGTFAH
jgi:hypothetical protein